MKHIYLLFALVFTSFHVLSQQQPNNAGFEVWENVGTDEEEPENWNAMMTGDLCTFCWFGASQRVFREESEVYSGTYSARIESTSAIGGIVVNGTMTTGRVTAPSTTPSEGYNQTLTGNSNFSHPFQNPPDSIVFWAKYNITDSSDSARISATFHDEFNVRDPQDAASALYVDAEGSMNFQTGGDWQRISLSVEDVAASSGTEYLLLTFTSSYSPGVGNSSATLYVDELAFVNATITNVDEFVSKVEVYPNPSNNGSFNLNLADWNEPVSISVIDLTGRTVYETTTVNESIFKLHVDDTGLFILRVANESGHQVIKKLSVNK